MKPLIWQDTYRSYADILIWPWEFRKTDSYKFMHGTELPTPEADPFGSEQDPNTYDLIYLSGRPEEKLLERDCLANNGQAPLVNQKVLDILSNICPNEFQAFPVVIKNETEKIPTFENKDYFLINVLRIEDLIDPEMSNPSYDDEGRFVFYHTIRLKSDFIVSSKLWRIKDAPSEVMVHPDVSRAFTKAKIRGVKFLRPEEYFD